MDSLAGRHKMKGVDEGRVFLPPRNDGPRFQFDFPGPSSSVRYILSEEDRPPSFQKMDDNGVGSFTVLPAAVHLPSFRRWFFHHIRKMLVWTPCMGCSIIVVRLGTVAPPGTLVWTLYMNRPIIVVRSGTVALRSV
ncbi:hypothetical protein CTI12_AA410430 [Artemisia annua]|uniref:Uncharacterized protein n=1 Tax=Artemisia annua TaxID=35608 RepID=A0A2U1M7Q7_ARTAN|nr:hypothetical protein CTI12_AA410430 [Artemisia annua]